MYRLYKNQERDRVYPRMSFFAYLKKRCNVLMTALLCGGLYLFVLTSYNENIEPILYAFVISMSLLLAVGICDYVKVRRKHLSLQDFDPSTEIGMAVQYKETDVIACDYQQIIRMLSEECTNLRASKEVERQELQDFYTLWIHQIKTPIAAMHLLLQTSPDNIGGIKQELFQIERYAEVMLGYSRLTTLNQDLELRHYSVEQMVNQALKKYAPMFIKSHLALRKEGLDCKVLTDEKWLVFVIEQLLSNAIKYTSSGEIAITAQVERKTDEICTRIQIQDTGIGIYAEDLPRIFDRAFTGYNGRLDKKASGLGLYLCNKILEKLKHQINISSEPGVGTCVTLTLLEDLNIASRE